MNRNLYNTTLFVLLFFLPFCFKAQNQGKIDSLTQLINEAPDDTNKVNLIYTLGRQYDLYTSKHHVENFIIAINLAKKISFKNSYKKIYTSLISYLFYKEMYDVSMGYCIEYIDFCEKEGNTDDKYQMYNMMGNLLTRQRKYNEAAKYYTLIKEYNLQKEDYKHYARDLSNFCVLYFESGQYDSALVYAHWAAEIFKRNNMTSEMANSVLGSAEIYLKKQDLERANEKAGEALTLYTTVNIKHGICNSLYVLAQVQSAQQKPGEAFKTFSKALAYADSLNLLSVQRDCYKSLSQMYAGLKNYKEAYEYQSIYRRLDDSISIDGQRGKMLEAEVKYDIAKKESLLKDQELEINTKNRQRNLLIGGIAVVLLLLVVSYRAYAQKKKSNQVISQQKKLVEEKQEELLAGIRYARRLQRSLLPSEKYIQKKLGQDKK